MAKFFFLKMFVMKKVKQRTTQNSAKSLQTLQNSMLMMLSVQLTELTHQQQVLQIIFLLLVVTLSRKKSNLSVVLLKIQRDLSLLFSAVQKFLIKLALSQTLLTSVTHLSSVVVWHIHL